MSALVAVMLVAYLLLLAAVLTLWSALTLGAGAQDRIDEATTSRRRHEPAAPPDTGADEDEDAPPRWDPRVRTPPPVSAHGLTNDDVRGLRVRERRGDASWLGPDRRDGSDDTVDATSNAESAAAADGASDEAEQRRARGEDAFERFLRAERGER